MDGNGVAFETIGTCLFRAREHEGVTLWDNSIAVKIEADLILRAGI